MTGLLFWVAGFVAGMLVWSFLGKRKPEPAATLDENGHWCFPVDTFGQMLAIPAERRERFLTELPLTFRRIWEMQDRYPLATLPGAVWVDDDKGELRPKIVNAPLGTEDAFGTRQLGGDAA